MYYDWYDEDIEPYDYYDETDETEDEVYDYYYESEDEEIQFYLDDDVDDDASEHQSSIVEVSSERMDMISAFVQQVNLNSADVNSVTGQTYFMQAIAAKRMDILHKFIEYQVDLNASDEMNMTPLHYAASSNNIECVCLLLSYGVDIRIESDDFETPLTLAYAQKHEEIVKYLLNYYYEFSNINLTNIKFDYKYKVDTYSDDVVLLTIAMDNDYVEPFKLIWQRIDLDEIINLPNDRFVQKYLHNSIYAPANKIDCLYSTLEITDLGYILNHFTFFVHKEFLSKNFDQTRRMDLLFMLLSTGAVIRFENINQIYQVCGFNKELEALIYATNKKWNKYKWNCGNPLLHFILTLNSNTYTYYNFCKQLKKYMNLVHPKQLAPWLKHFSLPYYVICNRRKLSGNTELLTYLRGASKFPSLLELGRLAVQNLIKQTYNIAQSYQFHDAVKQLCLPEQVNDIVLFKKPIYK